MITFLLFAIVFLFLGISTHRHALDHARMFCYPPVLFDVYYWLCASIVMGWIAFFVEASQ